MMLFRVPMSGSGPLGRFGGLTSVMNLVFGLSPDRSRSAVAMLADIILMTASGIKKVKERYARL